MTPPPTVWDPQTYDSERRRLVPCFDAFYGAVAELVARFCPPHPRVLDLGAGTGIVSGFIAQRLAPTPPRLTLLDASAAMLGQAKLRLANRCPPDAILIQPLNAELPAGPFDAIVSGLAIHHLSHSEKRGLFARIHQRLAPGGLFLDAEQVSGGSPRLDRLFEAMHLDSARQLGSSEAEIARAIQRMQADQCATVAEQLQWLIAADFKDVDCFFRAGRFAVFGGWKPHAPS